MARPVSLDYQIEWDAYVVTFDDGTQKGYDADHVQPDHVTGFATPEQKMAHLATCEPLPSEWWSNKSANAVAPAGGRVGTDPVPPNSTTGSVSLPRADEIQAFRAQFAKQGLRYRQVDRWVHDLGWRFSNGALKRYLDG